MPQARSKPSDIAAEAKRIFFLEAEKRCPNLPAKSIFYQDASKLVVGPGTVQKRKLRVAVIDGDPLDVALDWHEHNLQSGVQNTRSPGPQTIPIVNMANEKRAGGDWESGLMAPEECLCRRSNLVQALKTPYNSNPPMSHYPIPRFGVIYSPHVVIFRSGAEDGYVPWSRFKNLPVISIAPIKRPKLLESGTEYSFDEEKDIMKEKMRSILRIAAIHHHVDLCMGAFGVGPGFRNPPALIASMWRSVLFEEAEFHGVFANVVFAIEKTAESSAQGGLSDHDVFKKEFDPSNIVKTSYRPPPVNGR
ncbi:MAG: hypothetical protein L6R36_004165 [Xanthoria steineri]|nr:MAG: hypothetical protein L6R36_004165 [Xanthoria steineri]